MKFCDWDVWFCLQYMADRMFYVKHVSCTSIFSSLLSLYLCRNLTNTSEMYMGRKLECRSNIHCQWVCIIWKGMTSMNPCIWNKEWFSNLQIMPRMLNGHLLQKWIRKAQAVSCSDWKCPGGGEWSFKCTNINSIHNVKAWIYRQSFEDLFYRQFVPEVELYWKRGI